MKTMKKKVAILVAGATLVILAVVSYEMIIDLNRVFKETIEWIGFRGRYAPLVFMGMQIVQVLLFFIPGEIIQAAGGYAFGVIGGSILSVVGISAGSAIQFAISRKFGPSLVKRYRKKDRKIIDELLNGDKSKRILFILYLLPGFPKDIVGYVAGLTKIGFGGFIIITSAARIPGIVLSNFFGDNMFYENYLVALYIIVAAGILIYLSIIEKDKIMELFK